MGKVVIFDWGGVIMRTYDRSGRDRWERKLGLPQWGIERVVFGSDAWNEVQLGKRDIASYWQIVADKLGISAEELAQLRQDFYGGDRIDEDLVALIRELRAEGTKVGLMSNNSLRLTDIMTEHGLDDLFDEVVISAEIGVMKPAPEAFQAILDKLGVSAPESVFIDDYAQNIDGARAIGMHAIHFTPSIDMRAEIRRFLDDV